MKNFTLALFLSICISSCANEIKTHNVTEKEKPFSVTSVENIEITSLVNDYKNRSESDCFGNYDFSEILQISVSEPTIQETGYSVIFVNERENAPKTRSSSYEKSALGFIMKDGEIAHTVICTVTDDAANDHPILEYRKETGETIAGFEVDAPNGDLIPISSDKSKLTGQALIDCIDEAYTDHGWFSVFLWGTSIFAPEVGLIVGGVCVGAILDQKVEYTDDSDPKQGDTRLFKQ